MVQGKDQGPKLVARLQAMFLRLGAYYDRVKAPTRLDDLTAGMLKRRGEPAKLHSKAHECRCMLLFSVEEVQRAWSAEPTDPVLTHLKVALGALASLQGLSDRDPWLAERAEAKLDRLITAWCALEELNPDVFRVKPKAHLLLHLVGQVAPKFGTPSNYWCYPEEDWGGKLAGLAKVWGKTPKLGKFIARIFERAYRDL